MMTCSFMLPAWRSAKQELREPKTVLWEILHNLVDTLGVSGNSSDESNGENYVIRVKDWHSLEVKILLVYIDTNYKTTNEFGSHLPGA